MNDSLSRSQQSQFQNLLKDFNLKLTRPRQQLFEVLVDSERAMTPTEIYEVLEGQMGESVDKVSVYRNLSQFEELGLVHPLAEGTYKVCEHLNCRSHPHVILSCEDCGEAREISSHNSQWIKGFLNVPQGVGFLKKVELITFKGRCMDCEGGVNL